MGAGLDPGSRFQIKKGNMSNSNEYLLDVILPKHEVHLLGGPSGAGKTRWLLKTLLDWQQGLPVLGYQSYPVPWAYVNADRSQASYQRTMCDMGLDPASIRTIAAWDEQLAWHQIIDQMESLDSELFVVESFGSFVPGTSTSRDVKQHLQHAGRFLQRAKKTIIGVVESPKMKPYETYENPRQRISGAAAWGHFSETIFLMEMSNAEDPSCSGRQLYVCPRNGPGQSLDMIFDSRGCLVPSKLNEKPSKSPKSRFT
jgi:RecA-family ATPase